MQRPGPETTIATTTTLNRRGDIIVVEIAYSDASGSKPRPVVVMSRESFHRRLPDLIVAPITSRPRHVGHPGPGDVPITGWKAAGLRYPSAVRAGKILAVDKEIIRKKIGRLPAESLVAVEQVLRDALGLGGMTGRRSGRV